MKVKHQIASEWNWLYKDYSEDERKFSKEVSYPETETPWAECTTEEKEAWEAEHTQPEPENA